eukprot:m.191507 g.191507  ORF g.191507 m.191507 type:complete len:201 (-) comp14844_c1_seq1:193-795(-)
MYLSDSTFSHGHLCFDTLPFTLTDRLNSSLDRFNAVIMVRDPRQRLKSCFNYHKHANGISRKARAELMRSVKTPLQYAHYPGIAGCQVKMLNGLRCARPATITQDMVERAKIVVRDSAFLGITEHWHESICLFHAMYGGTPHPQSLHNTRQTASIDISASSIEATADTYSASDDPFDFELYEYARHIFQQRLRKYLLQPQ